MAQNIKEYTIKSVIEELRLLRQQIALLLPKDELKNYAHARRIERSYQKAIKEYPPAAPQKKFSAFAVFRKIVSK